ncbi:MAG: hypothetical protein KKC18_06485, partial [Chloroflexi bacterium]|nr:hypothetical protein [Chloroflexota bacterium]
MNTLPIRRWLSIVFGLILGLSFLPSGEVASQAKSSHPTSNSTASPQSSLFFIENAGQFAEGARFLVSGANGGALWLATTFVNLLPGFMSHGDALAIGVSVLTGTMTNFMSDGATVASLGPIVLPMATLAHVSIWKVGL